MGVKDKAVAIVGLGCILPDAPDVDTFWQNIVNKRYSISDVPPGRWGTGDYYDPDPRTPDKTYTTIGGWVNGFEFDWRQFRIPPKVAAAIDEGQQWALSISADALADYGYPDKPLNTENTAVILGTAMGGELHYHTMMRINFPEYANALESAESFRQLPESVRQQIVHEFHGAIDANLPPITEDSMPGELPNIVSGRVANVLNLNGPNFITDAACASSMAAVEAAIEMLTEHKVDAVLSGGVDRNMGIGSFVKFCKIGALSATGTRPFGAGADGFVMGEGAAVFLLKRLEDAERSGDTIYAVIRGVGGASDGKGKGITAPNPIGQKLAMQRAWANAGLDQATAGLIEAHGTSTSVGDAVELQSLGEVFGTAPRHSIALGSVKSNIGHLKAGAGAAGMLKAALALYHKVLPPSLNAETPNPNFDFENAPFYVNHNAKPWEKHNGTPRRAGVSAYGFGGTNFHIVLEEYVPGYLDEIDAEERALTAFSTPSIAPSRPKPVRGIFALGASNSAELKAKLETAIDRLNGGWTPPVKLPDSAEMQQSERLLIDFGDHDELLDRANKALKFFASDTAKAWKALQSQGIFRGSGAASGKVAFMFPGQGSQYVNMGSELAAVSPTVQTVFDEADKVMTPILGKPLTDYIFVDPEDKAAVSQANMDLMQTQITQPAMLTLDTAMYQLLADYGFKPDMVMGHSLGEYGGLIAAGIMPFAEALEAAAARGKEMGDIKVEDNGWMAAIMAPYDVVEATLAEIDGYVIPANINSTSQSVIGGASKAVEEAIALFQKRGYMAIQLPVSHAFHTDIVAPASKPLRKMLNRLHIKPPKLPLVANVTGELYPNDIEEIKDLLEKQIASTVQWVKGLQTLYANGVRTFVEVGPKRALRGFANDVFADNPEVVALMTNHPKWGELATFNQAICGLYAAGYLPEDMNTTEETTPSSKREEAMVTRTGNGSNGAAALLDIEAISRLVAQSIQQNSQPVNQPTYQPVAQPSNRPYDRNDEPQGSIIISGTGLGLPGSEKSVMDPDNALRILQGEQFVDLIPARFRKKMVDKRIVRLVKAEDGSGSFATIDDTDDVIKLAGRPGSFDLAEEYGVPEKLIEALDMTTQLAMAAGLDALREAGIPLVMTYKKTTTGKYLPVNWMLPEALRDETGVIFASAFPGGDRFAEEFSNYYVHQNRLDQINTLEDLRRYAIDADTTNEINRRINELRAELERNPYNFDRRFLFRILAMGHSQFAQYIGARGPNTQVNAACASTAQGIAIAEDWIRSGRCRRVIVIGADVVTGDNLMEWVGAGFLAVGAVTTNDKVEEAALPFDRRRHGTIMGMGACGLVVESEDAVRERGMRGIVELLSSETNNSAFHGTRLDVDHIAQVMNNLVGSAERRFGLNRYAMAAQTVFMSHETYTPARGGSASAEVTALRATFGDAANDVIISNTKGFTGHPMGVGVEDVIAVKILEYGIVPPVPNFKEIDPDLGPLNLSRGGRYPVQYAVHLAAGFGSQISMTLTRRIPGGLNRIDNQGAYQYWLDAVSGIDNAELEVEKRVLRIKATGQPGRAPAPSRWEYGTGPVVRAHGGSGVVSAEMPARMIMPKITESAPTPPTPAPATDPIKVDTVKLEPKPVVSEQPAAISEPVAEPVEAVTESPVTDQVADQVLAIVAEQTGYPSDMLDLDLDMEADLGIDTVKQAETFAAIREAFDIPRRDDVSLRDYNTLEKVIGFVKEMRPDLAISGQLSVDSEPEAVSPATAISDSATTDQIASRVLAIVSEQTGYPSDMLDLDLDMEADLGIDTVKQAETFAAIREEFDIPRRDDVSLRDYNTLERVIGFVKEMRPDLAVSVQPTTVSTPTPAVEPVTESPSQPVSASPTTDAIASQVLGIVSEQTGYPEDMLDLDLDLEADLGVDTVKQAETFAAIRETFDIPRRDDLNLREYNTLEKVIGFVREMRPDLVADSGQLPVVSEQRSVDSAPVAISPAPVVTGAAQTDQIASRVLAIVAEQTGYPEDMLELDLDLEADLGVDTVKQAETFATIREEFDIPRRDDLDLRSYNTLEKVIGFVKESRPELAVSTQPAAVSEPVTASPSHLVTESAAADPIAARVLAIVADQTGYPEDMLELDLDLEADLGVDTVKQAETFATIREEFDIPRSDDLDLRSYNTLEKVIGFVKESRPDLAVGGQPSASSDQSSIVAKTATESTRHSISDYRLEDADMMPRRVPTAALRSAEEWYKKTGVKLNKESRVIIMPDDGGVGKSLIKLLEKEDVTVLELTATMTSEEITEQIEGWLADDPIQGVYWLPALDTEPAVEELTLDEWRAANELRVKKLFATMKALYESISEPGTFLVTATRLGGMHGYGPEGATAPLGGAVTGFTKAYKRERGDVLVKAVDFAPSRKTSALAKLLVNETKYDPGVVEVGYVDDERFTVTLMEQSAENGQPGLVLDKETVFLVTGAAGGITSAIVGDLAQASGGTFYLLDLTPEPNRSDTKIAQFRNDKDGLKATLIDEAKARGERPTPVVIEKALMAIEREEAALRAIETVEAAGGTAHYHCVNLLDDVALTAVVDEIRAEFGRIDVLVHAGGIEISKALNDKPTAQFDLVFDIKADGMFSLLKAAAGMPIGAIVSFSSVAGRFGNSGQTDYSAANDLLCKLTSSLRRWRPETRGIVIDWTAWGGIGMATRGSIPTIMKAAGIDMLPPEAGVPTVRRELVAGNFSGEIVVGGALGIMVEEFDETGGLDLDEVNEWLRKKRGDFSMVSKITSANLYGGWSVETTVDPEKQPYLFDHVPDENTPWLPGVMATEALAEVATVLAPDYHVAAVEGIEMSGAFKFFRMEARTLYLNATFVPQANGDLLARLTLKSVLQPKRKGLPTQVKQHFAATVRLTTDEIDKPTAAFEPFSAESLPITSAAIYPPFFHGPAYQVLEQALVDGNSVKALVSADLPPNTDPADAVSLMAPRLIESCFQAAALWHTEIKGAMAFPLGYDAVTAYRQPDEADGKRLYTTVTTADDGETFDGTVVDENGNVFVSLKAYRTVGRPE
ncbi:MAG: SDR family NAD(P)-dependent oxidoreductase [Anaerolineae bacterium]|nr:SDR family NAD(P)-dependent oxidoreductase [Anaerolineae bacterium]